MVTTETRQLAERRRTVKRCPTCGASEGLVWRTGWVGGLGNMPRLQCRDQVECWARYDRQHNLRPVVC